MQDIDEVDRIGSLNLHEPSHLKIVLFWNISSLYISSNWWTGFKLWEDDFGILRTGTKLPIHISDGGKQTIGKNRMWNRHH